MKNITLFVLTALLLSFTACEKEEFIGDVKLVFTSNYYDLDIYLYPIEALQLDNLVGIEPLFQDLSRSVETLNTRYRYTYSIKGLNAGNYLWWDKGSRKGVFQVVTGKEKTYKIDL